VLASLRELAPEAARAFATANAAARRELEPSLYTLARQRVNAALGGAEAPADGGACAALADQFVVYVPEVSEEHLAPVREELGADGLETFVRGLYVLDMTERMRLALGRIFSSDEQVEDEPAGDEGLAGALEETHAAAMRLSAIDPVTTEVTRLRCAHYHDCKT
jgi:hypothetical protein